MQVLIQQCRLRSNRGGKQLLQRPPRARGIGREHEYDSECGRLGKKRWHIPVGRRCLVDRYKQVRPVCIFEHAPKVRQTRKMRGLDGAGALRTLLRGTGVGGGGGDYLCRSGPCRLHRRACVLLLLPHAAQSVGSRRVRRTSPAVQLVQSPTTASPGCRRYTCGRRSTRV